MTLTFRWGPGLPLALIIIGIILGRVQKYITQGAGATQIQLLSNYYRLIAKVQSSALLPVAITSLAEALDEARIQVYEQKFEPAKARLMVVEARFEMFLRMKALGEVIENIKDE